MSSSTADATARTAARTPAQPATPTPPQPGTPGPARQALPTSLPTQTRAGSDPSGGSAARALIAHYRSRSGLAFDVVGFAAPCPGCGVEAEWVQQREDTRVRTQISCPSADCPP